ncbi:hypothetical protein S7711_11366 [Stachybotrys chartarum IBT 7711]|uniref:Uncharacterized protein n=1 Tax=Stachybotrys chartarum (strain CBS 109288 / IBT 7711) TaxID=1280523 RepID=A0A084B537_STACB|nr:hypothetical protein S7711_11366 [Stachybotrys chartarum IBT 7711]KFA55175.1 hypothetical protein S40293_11344 [Stachybotrys chartarum IBT 40293]KFA79461.1 hypothetical protein S40288_11279 [Stachybotrys chartarum IBT 40288]
MYFSTLITSVGLLCATAVRSVPAVPGRLVQIESIIDATALGVDYYGPIPDDAILVQQGYWTANEGSKAWTWMRAQIDLPPPEDTVSSVFKRENYASNGVGISTQDWCQSILILSFASLKLTMNLGPRRGLQGIPA